MGTPTHTRRALSVNDIVELYHTSRAHVYRLKANGTLPFFRIGTQLRFWPEDVAAALLGQPVKEPTPAQRRAGLLDSDTIAFLAELASAAPDLTEERKDIIRAAFRDGGSTP